MTTSSRIYAMPEQEIQCYVVEVEDEDHHHLFASSSFRSESNTYSSSGRNMVNASTSTFDLSPYSLDVPFDNISRRHSASAPQLLNIEELNQLSITSSRSKAVSLIIPAELHLYPSKKNVLVGRSPSKAKARSRANSRIYHRYLRRKRIEKWGILLFVVALIIAVTVTLIVVNAEGENDLGEEFDYTTTEDPNENRRHAHLKRFLNVDPRESAPTEGTFGTR